MSKIEKAVFIGLFILCNSSLIVLEASRYFLSLGKSPFEAWVFSIIACLGVVGLVLFRGLPRYVSLLRWVLVIGIEAGLVLASVMSFSAPLLEKQLPADKQVLVETYRAELVSIRAGLRGLDETARAFGKRNPVNLSKTQSEIKKLRVREVEVSAKLEAALSSGAAVSVQDRVKVAHSIGWRVCLGLLNVIFAAALRVILRRDAVQAGANAVQTVAVPPLPGLALPAIAAQTADGDKNALRVVPGLPADAGRMTAREFVQSARPDAVCRRVGKGRSGPYAVFSENVELGRGNNSGPAWEAARRNLMGRAA